jgi:hypothetical protein
MKVVSVNANTDYLKNSFRESLLEIIEQLDKGNVQLGFVATLDEEGTVYKEHFTKKPGPFLFRLIGFVEYVKSVLLEEA